MRILRDILLLAAGGALGTLGRYALCAWTHGWLGSRFAWGTLAVNLLGCFLIGLGWSISEGRLGLSAGTRLMFLTGFLGAFTTFSTYILETVNFARAGQSWLATLNVAGSSAIGVLLVILGMQLGRLL